jgi:hypothetical protein
MNGLRLEDKLGANPFKYGMIGSTDSHVSLSTTREDNWFGKLPNGEPSAERSSAVFVRDSKTGDALVSDWELSAAGLAAVWAKDNTREAIFDALARKEVYATTGSRLTVRIFGGWDFEPDEVERHDFARTGYARGVPMGGDLTNGPDGKAPSFMSGIPTMPISTASRSSRAGSTATRPMSAFTTSPVLTTAPSLIVAANARSAVRWMSPTRVTRTRSAIHCSQLTGWIRISIPISAPFTTYASSRFRNPAGRPMMRSSSVSICQTT